MKTTNKSPWTNSIGLILVLIGSAIYIAQFFTELKKDPGEWPLYIGGLGLIIWLGFSDKFFKKFFGNNNGRP